MAIERRFKTITKRTARLLAGGENEIVDFKKVANGVHADDLVSFANASKGGDILVGVSEETRSDGSQFGLVTGSDLGDGTILQIMNKAVSCVPPVAVRVFAENTGDKALLRVHVPPSESKPHCTPKGVYCRRDGNRNRPLHPSELLEIFLNAEGRAFAARFEEASGRIIDDLSKIEDTLESSIESMAGQLGWAESNIDDTARTIDTVLTYVTRLSDESGDVSTRLRTLFKQDDRKDPVFEAAQEELLEGMINQLSEDLELFEKITEGGKVRMSLPSGGRMGRELGRDDMKEIMSEAIGIVREKISKKETPSE